MNVFANFDELPSMILQGIKLRKQNVTDTLSSGRTDRQHENSIPSHKHSLQGGGGGINIVGKSFITLKSFLDVSYLDGKNMCSTLH